MRLSQLFFPILSRILTRFWRQAKLSFFCFLINRDVGCQRTPSRLYSITLLYVDNKCENAKIFSMKDSQLLKWKDLFFKTNGNIQIGIMWLKKLKRGILDTKPVPGEKLIYKSKSNTPQNRNEIQSKTGGRGKLVNFFVVKLADSTIETAKNGCFFR